MFEKGPSELMNSLLVLRSEPKRRHITGHEDRQTRWAEFRLRKNSLTFAEI